ncbi:MAG: tetratricopeptide repeat protein [Nitrospina sp.]|nr:tetratricopeptide repeat protein [Nitrospina sp.]MBT6718157.1 tetratricopeptide repeat protein [Nitrospina sp.]
MSYWVFTFFISLVSIVAFLFISIKPKSSEPDLKEEKKPENLSTTKPVPDAPEKVAEWILKLEKSRTQAKEKLSRPPTYSEKFYGRNEITFEILKEIQKGTSTIILYGKPGMGKTTLALELIKKYQYNYHNLKLYINLKNEKNEPLSIHDAMVQILLSFHPAATIPSNKTQLNKLYKKVMKNQTGILHLDNVTHMGQIKALKPPSPWLVIATSNKKINMIDAIKKEILPLDIDSSQKFLVDCSLRLKPNAREIAKLCRGIPLALEMCGNFLSYNMKINPIDFLALFRKHWKDSLLEKSDEFEESLKAAFKAIFYSLSEKDQKVLCKLAVFPETFDAQAAGRVTEQNGESLQNISKYGLIKIDLTTKRYVLNCWIKEQVKGYLPETELREAKIRHATHYLSILDAAGESFSKGGEAEGEGLNLFHQEWKNINCGLKQVYKGSVEGKKSAELFNSYMKAGNRLFSFRFFPKEYRHYLEAALKISQRLGLEKIEIFHLLNIGEFLNSIFKYEDAKGYLDQAAQLAEKHSMFQVECQVLNELATYYLARKKPDEAIQSLLKKQNLERINSFEIETETSWARLGLAYEQKNQFENAINSLKEGLQKAKETGNGVCIRIIFKHLGSCYSGMKEFQQAEEYFEAGLNMARSLNKRKEEMDIVHQLGKMYVDSGDTDQATLTFSEGLELARNYRSSKFEGIFLTRIGDTYSLMSKKQKAVEFYMQAQSPLKKAKEFTMLGEIKQRLNRSSEVKEGNTNELEKIVKPVHKSKQGKGLVLMQARTNEFIKIGDNKMINYYIASVEEIIQDYQLNPKDSEIRERLNRQMGTLRENNHHACATILRQKFSL